MAKLHNGFIRFRPHYLLGYFGMPRRYTGYDPQYQVLNVMSSACVSILAVAYARPLFCLTWSLFYGDRASDNPWQATGVEWKTSSPPRVETLSVTPLVTTGPYDYPPPDKARHER